MVTANEELFSPEEDMSCWDDNLLVSDSRTANQAKRDAKTKSLNAVASLSNCREELIKVNPASCTPVANGKPLSSSLSPSSLSPSSLSHIITFPPSG